MSLLQLAPSPSAVARRRFEKGGRPLFSCAWDRVFMLHYEADPAALRTLVPFPLDLHEGRAYVSLVAFTLRDLRFHAGGPVLSTHRFLNVRTYVEGNGIFFLAEFLSSALCAFLGPRLYGLPYRLGRLDYRQEDRTLEGRVEGRGGAFAYRAPADPRSPAVSTPSSSSATPPSRGAAGPTGSSTSGMNPGARRRSRRSCSTRA